MRAHDLKRVDAASQSERSRGRSRRRIIAAMNDRDRDAAARRGTWVGVKPRQAPREASPELCHWALTWTEQRAVAVCGAVITVPVIITGTPTYGRHARCDEIARGSPALPQA